MDLELVETGNGGDLIKKKKDLSVIFGFENMPYICLFGGNVLQSTPSLRLANEQAFDYWGNDLLMQNDSNIQFNSVTERTLMQVALTSSGRMEIEQAVREDIAPLKQFANVVVKVSIVATDKVIIGIRMTQPDNEQNRDFLYLWDATNRELLDRIIVPISRVSKRYFADEFEFEFG